MTFHPIPTQHASRLQTVADDRRLSGTTAEIKLERILNSIEDGVLRGRFSREWVCGRRWIVDFFFPTVRLAIEVDGEYHCTPRQVLLDTIREAGIEQFGVTILRLSNDQVFGNQDELVALLKEGWATAKANSKHRKKQAELRLKKKKPITVTVSNPRMFRSRLTEAYAGGWTSLDQGENKIGDYIKRQYVDEGLAGTRDANREMLNQQSKEMLKRGRGGFS